MAEFEVGAFRPIWLLVDLGIVLVLELGDGWLLQQAQAAKLPFTLMILEVALPAHGLLRLPQQDGVLEVQLCARKLTPSRVHQETVGLVQEQMSPFSEVLRMAALEVVIEVVVAKVDVAVGIVELSQDLAAEDGTEELVRRVSSFVPILDAFGILLQFLDGLIVSVQQHFALGVIPAWLLPLPFFVLLLPFLLLGADLHRFLNSLLLLLLLFLLFEVLFGLVLSFADLCLLLLDLHLFLQQGGFLA